MFVCGQVEYDDRCGLFSCLPRVVSCYNCAQAIDGHASPPFTEARATTVPSIPRPKKSSTSIPSTHHHHLSVAGFNISILALSPSYHHLPSFPRLQHTRFPATMSSSSLKPSTIAAISVGTIAASFIAYAVYFDHRRRNDPDFRKQLKRDSKKQARAAKEEAEAQGKEQKKSIREAVERANEEGYPKDPEEIETYFMQEVAQGEGMCQSGMYNEQRKEPDGD